MSKISWAGRVALAGATALTCLGAARASEPPHETITEVPGGIVVTPASSQARPEDAGLFAHTNVKLFFQDKLREPGTAPPVGRETPASLACVYGFVKATKGCNPTTATTVATGGSKLVLIVDAYDDPTATNDLTVYSQQFGLPAVTSSNFEVVYAGGSKPPQDSTGGWELEESLDIEMAHAMAPGAKVILVEANSNSTDDLLSAETVAAGLAAAAGGGEVTNSWGEGEFSGESSYEKMFVAKNTVFFASTGDSAGTIFPSVLQNVVGAGGTTINRNAKHDFISQTTWTEGGGGSSSGIKIPKYQAPVKAIVGKQRGVPDFAFDANPISGVAIYDTTPYNGTTLKWTSVGGTSVASPALAASVNAAGSFAASTKAELTTVYKGFTNTAYWTDITVGTCGNNGGASAMQGYDFCTGIGVPNGYGGK
jgi:subtilase family serine protease